jgi:hypothetical protein
MNFVFGIEQEVSVNNFINEDITQKAKSGKSHPKNTQTNFNL